MPPPIRYFEPEIERLSREEIRALQLRLFREDLERVWHGNAFYRPRYEAAGLQPEQVRSLDDLRRVPLVRKEDVVRDIETRPPYGTRLGVPEHEIVNVVETSGTTGKGKEVQALTRHDWDLIVRAESHGFVWAGAGKGTVVAMNMPVTMTAAGAWWFGTFERLGCNLLRLGNADTTTRLHTMKRYGAQVMTSSAAYLLRLEHVAAAEGYDLQRDFPRLASIFCGGGGWTVGWAEERAARWNATLYEQYGSSQRCTAWTCERGIVHDGRPGMIHSLPHLCLIEVLDRERGRPVAPGDEGEVVITPLGYEGTPLIRYATGDRARFLPAEACVCGRAFDGIEAGSVARYDDMLRIKGINVWPDALGRIVFGHPEVAEFRGDAFVDGHGAEQVRVRVEFHREIDAGRRAEILHAVAREIERTVGLHFLVVEWDGPSLLGADGTGINPDTLKVRRWADRRRDALGAAPPAAGGGVTR